MADLRVIQGGVPAQQHRILVVDDEDLIRFSLAVHLEECGFEVREAADAASAISILQEPDCPIDLVFTDVRMPGEMDGLDLTRWIYENRPNIPVIIASGDMGRAIALKDLCHAEAIRKPFDFEVVADKIRQTIKGRNPPGS